MYLRCANKMLEYLSGGDVPSFLLSYLQQHKMLQHELVTRLQATPVKIVNQILKNVSEIATNSNSRDKYKTFDFKDICDLGLEGVGKRCWDHAQAAYKTNDNSVVNDGDNKST